MSIRKLKRYGWRNWELFHISNRNKGIGEAMKVVTLEQVNNAWGNANFGLKAEDRIAYLKQALDKVNRDYRNGWTMTQILMELNLLTKKRRRLTKRGLFNLANL